MAVRYATINGNWSNPAIWDGGTTIPGAGDTVYSNNKTVTVDVDVNIGDSANYNVNAGSFVVGQWYEIVSQGSPTPTDFTTIGASSNTTGAQFRATGVGTGDGVAKTVATLTNAVLSSPSITAGGGFTLVSGRTIRAFFRNGSTGDAFCRYTQSGTTTIIGNAYQAGANGSSIFYNNGSGRILFVGNAYGGLGAYQGEVLSNASTGTISIVGSIYPGNATVNNLTGCVLNGSTGTIEITAIEVFGPSTSIQTSAIHNSTTGIITGTASIVKGLGGSEAIRNAGNGTVSIAGNFEGGTVSAAVAIRNVGTGTITANGIATGGFAAHGISNDGAGTVNLTKAVGGGFGVGSPEIVGTCGVSNGKTGTVILDEIQAGPRGMWGALGPHFLRPGGQYQWRALMYTSALTTPATLLDASAVENALPGESDVRNGVGFNFSTRTGTCHVPAASSVAAGVPVDNTVGTAVLTPAAVQAIVGAAVAGAVTND